MVILHCIPAAKGSKCEVMTFISRPDTIICSMSEADNPYLPFTRGNKIGSGGTMNKVISRIGSETSTFFLKALRMFKRT